MSNSRIRHVSRRAHGACGIHGVCTICEVGKGMGTGWAQVNVHRERHAECTTS